MALVWSWVDEKFLDAVLRFASSSWARADLDASWAAAGWFVPRSGSVADEVFDSWGQRQWTGDRLVTVGLNADCSAIVAVAIEFATFVDPDEEDDGEPLVSSGKLEVGWSGRQDGTRADFDEVWRAAVGTLTKRFGAPAVVGMHDTHWHHAIWRVGSVLIALLQGEHVDTYGAWDEAALWIVPHPVDAPVPTGRELYDVMWGHASAAE